MSGSERLGFPRACRLQHKREFDAVYASRSRVDRGPLSVHALPTDRSTARLGLAVGRRVGCAVVRSRIKRLLREAFRLERHGFPASYDVVVAVRPHAEPLTLDRCRALLVEAIRAEHALWTKRSTRRRTHADAESGPRTDGTSDERPAG
jgi:ribonuclease P protein component